MEVVAGDQPFWYGVRSGRQVTVTPHIFLYYLQIYLYTGNVLSS